MYKFQFHRVEVYWWNFIFIFILFFIFLCFNGEDGTLVEYSLFKRSMDSWDEREVEEALRWGDNGLKGCVRAKGGRGGDDGMLSGHQK